MGNRLGGYMATPFSPVAWIDFATPDISAANLQRYETFLTAIASGGAGGVVLADLAIGRAHV